MTVRVLTSLYAGAEVVVGFMVMAWLFVDERVVVVAVGRTVVVVVEVTVGVGTG